MKRLILLFCTSPLALLAQQPTITFRAPQAPAAKVQITVPVAGNYFVTLPTDTILNSKGELNWPNKEQAPAEFTFGYQGQNYVLFVKPGQSYTISVNQEQKFNITGADAPGQEALSRLKLPFYQDLSINYYRTDSIFAHNRRRVLSNIDSVMAPFKTLLADKQIDQVFYDHAFDYVRTYYANVLAGTFAPALRNVEANKDKPGYDKARLRQMKSDFESVFTIADPHDLRLHKVSTVFWYTKFYADWYLKYLKPAYDGTLVPFSDKDQPYKREYSIVESFRDPEREYQTATLLKFMLLQEGFEPYIVDWFEAFKDMYPNSVYLALLEPGVDGVRDYLRRAKGDFASAQRFIENAAGIKTVSDLAARFKGKTVYVDLWATWCGPCKEEFNHTAGVKKLLADKGGEMLYISIDRDQAEPQWKDMIKYYNLDGYHVRASPALMDDVRKLFGSRGSLAIPRYAIIKDGKIVVDDARKPSDGKALLEQLSGYF
jgi:thiol-disulfide isomerase/thioredoxin